MEITYQYTVKKVNQEEGWMEVEFTCPGCKPVLVGMNLPPKSIDIKAYIADFAPLSRWEVELGQVHVPPVNTMGVVVIKEVKIAEEEPEEEKEPVYIVSEDGVKVENV